MTSPVLVLGDCVAAMAAMEPCSVDAIVTDPPYGLEFMGKGWDRLDGDARKMQAWHERWAREALRVLKPGGYLVAFGGTRTYHRLACAVEDAGFEIRDRVLVEGVEVDHPTELAWMYGEGFPKSRDVSKAIDAAAGAEREVVSEGRPVRRMIPGADQNDTGSWIKDNGREFVPTVTEAATEDAARWEGWGTALKPAHEPIVVARKPLGERNVAANVLRYGVGAINVDATRVDARGDALGGGDQSSATKQRTEGWDRPWMRDEAAKAAHAGRVNENVARAEALGRWPANVVLVHGDGCARVEGGAETLEVWECVAATIVEHARVMEPGFSLDLSAAQDERLAEWLLAMGLRLRVGSRSSDTGSELESARERVRLAASRLDSQGDCPVGCRCGDVRVLLEAADDRGLVQRLDDALELVLDPERSRSRIPVNRRDALLSSSDDAPRSDGDADTRESRSAAPPSSSEPSSLESDPRSSRKESSGSRASALRGSSPASSSAVLSSGPESESGIQRRFGGCRRAVALWAVAAEQSCGFVVSFRSEYRQGCPVRTLDEQSGATGGGLRQPEWERARSHGSAYGEIALASYRGNTYGDTGGASRFFYCAKTSATERSAGLVLCSCETSRPWASEGQPVGIPAGTATRPTPATTESGTPSRAASDSPTTRSGNERTDALSPTDSRSTTETATSRTTTSRTSSSSPTSTTSESTPRTTAEAQAERGSADAPSAGNGSQRTPSTSTSPAKDGSPLGDAGRATSERSSSSSSGELVCPSCGGISGGHPTVKPVELMRWLVRLVVPPGGLVLDPFLGSGTTGIAAGLEGARFVGVERDAGYLRIAVARIVFWGEHGEDAVAVVRARERSAAARRELAEVGQLSFDATPA